MLDLIKNLFLPIFDSPLMKGLKFIFCIKFEFSEGFDEVLEMFASLEF